VIAGNADLGGQPELINQDPYGAGWIMRIRPDDKAQFAALLDAKATRRRSPRKPTNQRTGRHALLPHTADDIREMLAAIGAPTSRRCSTRSRPSSARARSTPFRQHSPKWKSGG